MKPYTSLPVCKRAYRKDRCMMILRLWGVAEGKI